MPALVVPMTVVRGLEAWCGVPFTLDLAASPVDSRPGASRFVGRYDSTRERPGLFAVAPGPEEFVFVNTPWRLVASVGASQSGARGRRLPASGYASRGVVQCCPRCSHAP
jgi:hypothetical protein